MRIFSALVLTHCFGCVIPEDSDTEFTFGGFRNVKSVKKNISEPDLITISSGLNEKARYNTVTDYSFNDLTNALNSLSEYHENAKDFRKTNCTTEGYISDLPNNSLFVSKKCKNARIASRGTSRKYCRSCLCRMFKSYNKRKLFMVNERRTRSDDFHGTHKTGTFFSHSRLHHRKRNFEEEDVNEADDELSDDWDSWGAWSSCSVTCGCGQQVRWRHCVTEDCVQGLKRVQIKTCHVKPCDTGFFKWLGIKN